MKSHIKKKLSQYPMIFEYFKYFYHFNKNYWKPRPGDLNLILDEYFSSAEAKKGVIQIGANDGVSGDPIFGFINKTNIPAVLVEPVPRLFSILKSNHKENENVTCVNAAVSACSESIPFYVVDNSAGQFPEYFDQLGSFKKSIIERQKRDYPDVVDHIDEIDVRCMSFDELVSFANIDSSPFLHIDAEGYDLDVLEMVDFSRFGYRLILFEHVHLDLIRYRNFIAKLKNKGYILRTCLTDTIALKR